MSGYWTLPRAGSSSRRINHRSAAPMLNLVEAAEPSWHGSSGRITSGSASVPRTGSTSRLSSIHPRATLQCRRGRSTRLRSSAVQRTADARRSANACRTARQGHGRWKIIRSWRSAGSRRWFRSGSCNRSSPGRLLLCRQRLAAINTERIEHEKGRPRRRDRPFFWSEWLIDSWRSDRTAPCTGHSPGSRRWRSCRRRQPRTPGLHRSCGWSRPNRASGWTRSTCQLRYWC